MKNSIYLPGLNGLRAIAAMSVVIAHVFQVGISDFGLTKIFDLPMAGNGVTLFFVISGFLITYLLLIEIQKTDTVDIKKFYLRRILRIWPIYYLFIFIALTVLFLLNEYKSMLVPEIWFYIFFSANIPFVFHQGIMIIVHYWSIGVEEQFYLFWPWLVRFSRKNILLIAISLFVFFFFAKLLSWTLLGSQSFTYRFFVVTRFHCMMLGAITAFVLVNDYKLVINVFTHRLVQFITWITFVLMGFDIIHIPALIGQELIALLSIGMILSQVTCKAWIFNLENIFCDFIGKISYGIYVIHPLVILLLSRLYKNVELILWLKYLLVYGSVISITILMSWLSHRYFEKPFLKLKGKFTVINSSNSMILK